MTSVGYSTLDVIPSFRGFKGELERGTIGPSTQVGRAAGTKFGAEAGTTAGKSFGGKFSGALRGVSGGLFAPIAAAAAGVGVVKFFQGAFDEAREAATVGRQTAAVLKATGGAANVTAGQIDDLSQALSKKVGVDDEAIQSGANLLLTFRNIKNEVGSGNDIFNQATGAILDISAAMDQDLKSSAVQVGKALNDPVKGMTALQRAGVMFTQQQKDQAKALVENGDLLGAQKIILGELNKEFAGAAQAGHDAFDKLGVSFKNFQEDVGTKALPVAEAFAGALDHAVIPALDGSLTAVGKIAGAFNDLPGPVKAATGALVAFRLAAALGVNAATVRATSSLASGMESLRLRTMFAADSFKATSAASGRMTASLAGLRAGAAGAGSAITRGLGGALSLVGGPWGVAFIAGTAILAKFQLEHQKTKQFVDDLTASLDEQTGALTENTHETIFKELQDSGAIEAAKRLGISLKDLQAAAEGNDQALSLVNSRLHEFSDVSHSLAGPVPDPFHFGDLFKDDDVNAANKVRDALGGVHGALDEATTKARDKAVAFDRDAAATDGAAGSTKKYVVTLSDARAKILQLLDAENRRRNKLLQSRQDQVALNEAILDARKAAREGAKGLEGNTRAANENNRALDDLASQWNASSRSVQTAKGAYKNIRDEFIRVAVKMGDTKTEARKLADEILNVPKKVGVGVSTPGMEQALADLRRLQSAIATANRNRIIIRAGGNAIDGGLAAGGPATSGMTYLVGERGPELFTPNTSGRITPNDKLTQPTAGVGLVATATFSDDQVRILASAIAAGAAKGVSDNGRAFAAGRRSG